MDFNTDHDQLKTLSIEQLRQFEGFGHVSDEQAVEIIETLKELTLITHSIVSRNDSTKSVSKLRKKRQKQAS